MLTSAHKRGTGFSLIEIVVALAILGFALLVAAPSFKVWIHNTKIRTTAESISYGLMLARTEAIRRNAAVRFVLDSATSSGWTVAVDSDNSVIQRRYAAEGSENIFLETSPAGATTITYTAIGWTRANADASNTLGSITANTSSLLLEDRRKLTIMINAGGGVRVCDPLVSGSDPRAC